MLTFEKPYASCRALVTGHSGFTGGWLTSWLHALGADITGVALPPPTTPSLFELAKLSDVCRHIVADIRDADRMREIVADVKPDIVFHLAAQPLVSRSYEDPIESFAVNALGTAHVLEAARNVAGVKGVVCITTDKVYEDRNWAWGYRETDRLGGKDPYSASKACAELVAASYRATMTARANGMKIAVARGGNIIGGGDWANNRIVPDYMRALFGGSPLVLRNPEAVRPWQHVLALVHGYLMLGAGILTGKDAPSPVYNFGPRDDEAKSVRALIEALASHGKRPDIRYEPGTFIETKLLRVDSSAARGDLGWRPPIGFDDTVAMTMAWYDQVNSTPTSARAVTKGQIDAYRAKIGTA
ncbi:MAG: CDP-glucose 4,6-dehydratase [Hyphomicrobium sp.]